ncbi:MAG: hypothetical protein B0D92_06690 [Spirochaeta sp. LUC14_002_19_P3]|nr:MAG: hypothetical protein B0D92_06690 [Spirochaeta sp. LUC14_002_19_P3]
MNRRTALVTGSAVRIGKAIALKMASEGIDVLIHARTHSPEAETAVNAVRSMGVHSELALHDLRDSEGVGGWFEELYHRTGGIDILVNSACSYPEGRYDTLCASTLNEAMAEQLLSPLAMMRVMKHKIHPGTVVNILDSRIADRNSAHAAYHLAKRSLFTLTRDLAMEYAPSIRVNAVAPGIILPPKAHGEEWLERMASTNPLNTHGRPEDVAEAVFYLVQAPFVTGQIIYIDGGRHLKGCAYGH